MKVSLVAANYFDKVITKYAASEVTVHWVANENVYHLMAAAFASRKENGSFHRRTDFSVSTLKRKYERYLDQPFSVVQPARVFTRSRPPHVKNFEFT
jgi:hypothetical protein